MAVDHVSFQIDKGECVAVIGQNGAGKTTMMKLMSGLLLPTTGKIEVLNYNPFKKEKAYKKSITLLLGQKQQLWWDVSAKDNYLLLKDIYEEVKKALRSVVCMKYKIKDKEVFDKAYSYIEQYYRYFARSMLTGKECKTDEDERQTTYRTHEGGGQWRGPAPGFPARMGMG